MPPRDVAPGAKPTVKVRPKPVGNPIATITHVVVHATAPPNAAGPKTDAQTGGPAQIQRANTYKQTSNFRSAVQAAKTAASQQKYDAAVRQQTAGRKLVQYRSPVEQGIREGRIPGPSVLESKTAPVYVRKAPHKILGVTVDSYPNQFDILKGGKTVGAGTLTKQSLGYKQDVVGKAVKASEAPALRAINQTTRPYHAIASAADAAVTGHNVLHAAVQGAKLKSRTSFSDVLKHVGVPKGVAAVAGFGLDVAADPTTYVTFGAGSVGAHAAETAARKATADAIKAGASKKLADRAGRAAARDALNTTANKGIQVGLRGHVPFTDKGFNVQTSGRTTAAISRKTGISKAATKVRETGLGQALGKGLNPDFRPIDRTPAQHQVIREAQREHRMRSNAEMQSTHRMMHALHDAVPNQQDQSKILDAIEAKNLSTLPADHQTVARYLIGLNNHLHAEKRARGLGTEKFKPQGPEDAQAYVPHIRADMLEQGSKKSAIRGGQTRVAADYGRAIRKPLAATRVESPGLFTENIAKIAGAKRIRTTAQTGLHDFWQKIATTGRPLNKGATINHATERVYRVDPEGLVPLERSVNGEADHKAIAAALHDSSHRYIILNRQTVDEVKSSLANHPSTDELLHYYDKIQGTLKKAFTLPNPGYHLRNLYGDTTNAFLGDASAHSFGQAVRVLGARAGRNRVDRTAASLAGATHPGLDTPLNLGKAGTTTLGKELGHAEKHGAIGQGFIGRELPDLTANKGRLSRAFQYREDWPRLATYLSARKRGLSPTQAADWSLKHHFDYGDLTQFERTVGRRVIPFYTFFARNTKLQLEKIVTRPGKYATIGKLLDETAKAAGFSSYQAYSGNMKDYEQRGLPIPLKVGGKTYNLFVSLPTTDLNQATANPSDLAQSIANRVTFYKSVGELLINYSIFFQDKIAPAGKELTEAPPEVGALPAPVRSKLGITQVNGKWMWDRRADYALRSLPFGNFALQQLLPSRGTRNQTGSQARLSFLTGVRSTPYSGVNRTLSQVQTALHDAQVAVERMRNRGQAGKTDQSGNVTSPTGAYQQALDRVAALTQKRNEAMVAAGARTDGPVVKLDGQLLEVNRQLRDAQHAGKAVDQYGYATKDFQALRNKRNALERQRAKLAHKAKGGTIKARPLTPEDQLRQQIKQLRQGASPQGIKKQLRDEMNRLHEQAKVASGG